MPTYTTAADVADRWVGGDLPADTAQVERLLEDAEAVILQAVPDLADRVVSDPSMLGRVKRVAARVVIRYLNNPASASSLQQQAGAFGETISYTQRPARAEGIYLTEQDRVELLGTSSSRAYTVNTLPPGADAMAPPPDPWVGWPA